MAWGEQLATPAFLYRGGLGKVLLIKRTDLPVQEGKDLDSWVFAAFGSPDAKQLDGIGGGSPESSRIAIVGRATGSFADIEYSIGFISPGERRIDWGRQCGNVASAVAQFSVDEKLIEAHAPLSSFRIYNTNTKSLVQAEVLVENGNAKVIGPETADVANNGAPISLDFRASVGSNTGRLLPTGSPKDRVEAGPLSIPFSAIDLAKLMTFVPAEAFGLSARETFQELSQSSTALDRIDRFRTAFIEKFKCPSPIVTIFGEGDGLEIDVFVRTILDRRTVHKDFQVQAAACAAVCSCLPGSVLSGLQSGQDPHKKRIRIGHLAGFMVADSELANTSGAPEVRRAAVIRTARRIMSGEIFVPRSRLPWLDRTANT